MINYSLTTNENIYYRQSISGFHKMNQQALIQIDANKSDKYNNISFKGQRRLFSFEHLQLYKMNPYVINNKLRGINPDKLTNIEKAVIDNICSLPRKILNEDNTVYRGIVYSDFFNPQEHFIVGKIFEEKGFTALSPIKSVAENFAFRSCLLEIKLPKGTQYIDIDSFLIDNLNYLWKDNKPFYSKSPRARHEWILPPDAKFFIENYIKDQSRYYELGTYKMKLIV